jgi:membrane-associated phospholipid phosphatase
VKRRIRSFLAGFVCCGAALSPPAAGQTATEPEPSIVREWQRGGTAGIHVLTAPLHWTAREWLVIPLAGAGLAGVSLLADREVARFMAEHQSERADDVLSAIEPFGDNGAAYLLAALYAGGLAAGKPALRKVAIEGAVSGTIASGIIVVSLKALTGRARPREERGTHTFAFLGEGKSFPAGHAAGAFSVASVFAAHTTKRTLQIPLYTFATGIGIARLYHGGHFVSDVIAGALIGTVVGRGVVGAARAWDLKNVSAAPLLRDGAYGVSIELRVP